MTTHVPESAEQSGRYEADTDAIRPRGRHRISRDAASPDGEFPSVPIWFEYIILIGCAAVLSFGGFGLLLAVIGKYSAGPAFLLGAAGTVGVTVLGRPTRLRAGVTAAHTSTLPTASMVVSALGITLWNAIYATHHVAVEADPGVYAVAGRWLASHGSLTVPGGAAWANSGLSLSPASVGMYPRPGGSLQFQFAHLLPVLLAEAHRIGGDALMFRVPAILGGLGLLTIYVVGCRLVRRPWLVFAAVTALGLSLPELYISRDTFSEAPTQVLLWGGIWLLIRAYGSRRATIGLVAGLVLGGTMMTRIDAVAYMAPLPLLGAIGWLSTRPGKDRRELLRTYGGILVGILPPAILGTLDVRLRSTPYYYGLHHEVFQLYELLILSTVASLVLVAFGERVPRIASALGAWRPKIASAAGWVVGVGLLLAWSIRPAGPKKAIGGGVGQAIASLQHAVGVPVLPESYSEQSMQWIGWYLGPVLLGLAIIGVCVLTVQIIRRGSVPGLVVMAMTAPLSAIYLWSPDVTPQQLWALRRFVPTALPLIAIAAAVAIDGAVSLSSRYLSDKAWPRRLAFAGAAAAIVFPLGASLPVGRFSGDAGYVPLVDQTCKVIGSNAAVVFPTADYDQAALSQTLRSWCNVPVATPNTRLTPQQFQALAAYMKAQGRTLWLLSSSAINIQSADPSAVPMLIGQATDPHALEITVDRPAQHYLVTTLVVFGAQVAT